MQSEFKYNEKSYLDKFYTNPKIANLLVKKMFKKLLINKFNLKEYCFLEPSAGSGSFINSLIKMGVNSCMIQGYDIEPKQKMQLIKQQDFLKLKPNFKENRIVIGNPPFGKRANLAIKFLNHSYFFSNTIAMILPKQFERYLTQKQINKDLRLIMSINVVKDAFLINNKKYHVNTVFQIWTTNDKYKHYRNKRKLKNNSIKHKDIETWIHNNTQSTLKYFKKYEFKWDYAIYRQGFYNYNQIIKNEKDLFENRQYLFIRVINPIAHKIIELMDFEKLSKSNTQIPGFSKTDFIKEYVKIKRDKNRWNL